MNDVSSRESTGFKRRLLIVLTIVVLAGAGWAGIARAATRYIDCSASTNGSGTSTSSPWNSLASANSTTFSPGDSLLLKRGTGATCSGSLTPGGSGNSTSRISIGAYGTGSRPVIDGGSNTAALKLLDQQYWNISDLELKGGDPYGLFISGNTASTTLHGFSITNVDVHDVNGDVTQTVNGSRIGSMGGGIVVAPAGNNEIVDNVVVDGATVENTHQWAGIRIGNSSYSAPFNGTSQALSTNATIQNSVVHDVWGSGITIFETDGGLMQSNVAYHVGLEPSSVWVLDDTTPNGIWGWYCHNCLTQYNESYDVQTPWLDGGEFDIDTYSASQTVQYNYGHDSVGYCVGVLGTNFVATTNSVVRYNICSNNGKYDLTNSTYPFGSPGVVGVTAYNTYGDFYLFTWASGTLDGVQIYNNTSYWNPLDNQPALFNNASFSGTGANFFKNNIVYATSADLMNTANSSLSSDSNLWFTSNASPSWIFNNTSYTYFAGYVSGSGQDVHGMYADPILNSPTYHSTGRPTTQFTVQNSSPAIDRGATVSGAPSTDFFGNTVAQATATDIGAAESSYTANDTSGIQAINSGGGSNSWFGYDNDYIGGSTYTTTHSIDTSGVGAPAPQGVYQSERFGSFTYTFGGLTANDGYLVRLHESENYWTSANSRKFNVIANGTQVLTNFDIYAAAGGQYKAVVVEFYVTADSNGKIAIQFAPGTADQPKVDGIEIDKSPSSTTSTINSGGSTSGWFSADTAYSGGNTYTTTHSIDTSGVGAPAPQAVYQTERNGSFTYTMTGFTAGQGYLVRLHESENGWNSAGARQFNVIANGTQVLTNYDIYAAAGGQYKAVVPEFFVTADGSGHITLQFTTGAADLPKVDGIEVLL